MSNILRYLLESRGLGHTTAAIKGAELSNDAVLVVHNHTYANELTNKYKIKAISINDLYKLRLRKPVIFDNSALIFELSILDNKLSKCLQIMDEIEKTHPGLIVKTECNLNR